MKKTAKKKKVAKVMKEFKSGTLNSGSSTGPVVTNRRQAVPKRSKVFIIRINPDRCNGQGSQVMNKAEKKAKVAKVMREFKGGSLHSGKKGPVVKNKKQAVAIALSEAKMAKKRMGKKK